MLMWPDKGPLGAHGRDFVKVVREHINTVTLISEVLVVDRL